MADLKQERKEAADCLKSTFPPFRILIPTMAKKILHVFELVLTWTNTFPEVEPLLNEDGEYIKGSETKSLVNELQVEYQKSTSLFIYDFLSYDLSKKMFWFDCIAQEVVTMLREKLVVIGGDLVVAKSRVRELEMNLLDDKLSLKKSAETLLESSGFFCTF